MLHDMRSNFTPATGVLLLAAVAAGCTIEPTGRGGQEVRAETRPDRVSAVTQAIRSFPCDSASMAEMNSELAAILADTLQANEFHDCQKLIVNGEFGPLVAIYPQPAVEEQSPASFAIPRLIATVFNWGPDRYAPLGIDWDWNCVWLQWQRGADRWAAVMARPTADGCVETGAEQLPPGLALDVPRPLTYPGTLYPATARWGWDAQDEVHYIGVKCGAAWCALGPPGFTPRETSLGQGAVHEVPGWYDDQHLAVPDANGNLVPGPWAKIHPTPNLGRLTAADFAAAPQVVAFVTLAGTTEQLAHYETTWNFRASVRNTLKLWNRDGHETTGWYLIVEPDGAQPDTFSVIRTPTMHAIPGAVRWRWDSRDESGWIPCGGDCCSPKLDAS